MTAINKTFVILTVATMFFASSDAKAGGTVVDCCRPVVCCRPVIIDCCRRPLVSALRNARMALHYHANYRVYRDVVYAQDSQSSEPTPAQSTIPAIPLVPAQPAAPAVPIEDEPKQPESLPAIDLGEGTESTEDDPGTPEGDSDSDDKPAEDSDDSFQLQDPNSTTFRLQVPENARVFVNDKETTSTGTQRIFSASNLDPNQQYRFRVRVQWSIDGQSLTSQRTLVLRPGTLVSVDMRSTGVNLTIPTAVQQ